MEKKPFERPFIKRLQAGMPSKFGMKVATEPLTHIDDVSVSELLEKHGSPLY
ncbi:MAG TPA: diaminopimelate decarboxylase, partial [Bacteroides sp.]|nr:diaminopimelate decarboxylase [Bacteroides sp.]